MKPAVFGFTPGDGLLVTGAGAGIGRATAIAGAAQGLRVVLWDINGDTAEATAAEIRASGGQAEAACVDIAHADALAAAFAQAGSLRYLVNNAAPPSSASHLSFAEGIEGALIATQRVTTHWREQLSDYGALVNMASIAGNFLGAFPDWYPSAKAGLMGFTRHLAVRHADQFRANAIAPGMTATARLAAFAASPDGQAFLDKIPLKRMAEPEDIASAALFLLSPIASYITGVLLPVDGGVVIV